ncbi:MAG: hypothetical protein ABI725_07140 [Chloroflexota bacterium]
MDRTMVCVAIALALLASACTSITPPTSGNPATPTAAVTGPTVRDLAQPAILFVQAHPNDFGGAYVDAAGSALHVLYVGEADKAGDALRPVLPPDLPVVWQSVRHTASELSRIQSEIIELWRQIGQGRIVAVSVDVVRNLTVVGTLQLEPALITQLHGRYGDAVVVEIQPPDAPA